MPDRMIRDRAKTSSTLAKLSHGAERLFWRLTITADNTGRFHAEPQAVRASCFPVMLEVVTQVNVDLWLVELEKTGAIQIYEVDGRMYGAFCKWQKYQRLYNHQSKFPEPPATPRILPQLTAELETELETELELNTLVPSRRRKSGSRKVKTKDYAPDFEVFWQVYPRKIKKYLTSLAWAKVNGDGDAIMAALEWQTKSRDFLDKDRQYIPHPATWLNQRRWEDPKPPDSEAW